LVSENVETDERLCSFVEMVEDLSDEVDAVILLVSVVVIESNVSSLVILARAGDSFEFSLLFVFLNDIEYCEFDKFD
jgi:hypothetical protein